MGPLSDSQMAELIAGGVIERETYVWRDGMLDWVPAISVTELTVHFVSAPGAAQPPPPPPSSSAPKPFGSNLGVVGRVPAGPTGPTPPPGFAGANPNYMPPYSGVAGYGPGYAGMVPVQQSDKSKVVAGILNMIIPGVGRMYLGYPVIGVLQLLTTFCAVGIFWAFVDGLLMLTGNVKEDGYGRPLP